MYTTASDRTLLPETAHWRSMYSQVGLGIFGERSAVPVAGAFSEWLKAPNIVSGSVEHRPTTNHQQRTVAPRRTIPHYSALLCT
eukprot:15464276-Alexandrium_andersonii.AAC.1